MARFVLLLHDCPDADSRPTHYDLMFEVGETLQTWALNELPCSWKFPAEPSIRHSLSNAVTVERLADHRLAYLDYEGPVSGDRGHVRRIDAGTFATLPESLSYSLNGQLIRGTIKLESLSDDAQWQLVFTAK